MPYSPFVRCATGYVTPSGDGLRRYRITALAADGSRRAPRASMMTMPRRVISGIKETSRFHDSADSQPPSNGWVIARGRP
jgi:hypothetical protein